MTAGGDPERPVLVTGGSGYLAGFVIVELLREGQRVRATIRDLARGAELRATLGRHASTDRLSFCAADLLADAGWDAAVEDTSSIIHVASPMPVREYRKQNLEHCRRLLGMPARQEPTDPLPPDKDYRDRYEELTGRSLYQCPVCGQGRMLVVAVLPKYPCHSAPPIDSS